MTDTPHTTKPGTALVKIDSPASRDLVLARDDAARIRQVPGLDGLRGIAVAAVVLYHAFPDRLPGGFLGVDVFFVLSGFLITSLLLRERTATGRVSLKRFWLRRVRRILPMTLTALIVTTTIAGLIGGDTAVRLPEQFFSTAFFVNNWAQIAMGQSYFADSAPSVTMHYWSLAVEEQFYLLWPLLFIVLSWVGRRAVLWFSAVGALASAVLMGVLFDPAASSSRVYFGTDTHAFGLMIGAMIAALTVAKTPTPAAFSFQLPRPARGLAALSAKSTWFSFSGATLVALAVFFLLLDGEDPVTYRGGIPIACLLAGVVTLGALRERSAVNEWLNLRALRWLGQRSFSVYLWHWPAIIITRALMPQNLGWLAALIAVAVTLAFSEVSFRWVENPFRRRGIRAVFSSLPPVRTTVVALILTGACTLGLINAPRHSQLEIDFEQIQATVDNKANKDATPGRNSSRDGHHHTAPTGSDITAVGDSVLLAASEAVQERYPGIDINASVSSHYEDGLTILRQQEAEGTLRDIILLSFGTNGSSDGAGNPNLLADVRDIAGPHRAIIYVLPFSDRWYTPDAEAELLAESRSNNQVYIANWCQAARDDQSLLRDDLIHPTPAGALAYVDAIADALDQWVNDDKQVPSTCGA